MKYILGIAACLLVACCQGAEMNTSAEQVSDFFDLSLRDKPESMSNYPWSEVVINVPDPDSFSQVFTNIGNYETVARSNFETLLKAPNSQSGYIRLRQVDENSPLTRPSDAQAWDTGCYWSVMMRAKNVESIVEDATAYGWKPHAPVTFLKFGPSELHVVVLRHQVTGVQLQLYERLTTPLPENFPEFERISMPFNLMQMVEDRDVAYDVVQQGLGFETFYYGKPFLSEEPENMPLGLPKELTTEISYEAAIVSPNQGDEVGRLEMIAFEKDNRLQSRDFSALCKADNIGIIEVRYPVDDISYAAELLTTNGLEIESVDTEGVSIKMPDGGYLKLVPKSE